MARCKRVELCLIILALPKSSSPLWLGWLLLLSGNELVEITLRLRSFEMVEPFGPSLGDFLRPNHLQVLPRVHAALIWPRSRSPILRRKTTLAVCALLGWPSLLSRTQIRDFVSQGFESCVELGELVFNLRRPVLVELTRALLSYLPRIRVLAVLP